MDLGGGLHAATRLLCLPATGIVHHMTDCVKLMFSQERALAEYSSMGIGFYVDGVSFADDEGVWGRSS